jgi:hypothetical protein
VARCWEEAREVKAFFPRTFAIDRQGQARPDPRIHAYDDARIGNRVWKFVPRVQVDFPVLDGVVEAKGHTG